MTLASLESGARVGRAYLDVSQDVFVDGAPVIRSFDLVGGAQVAILVTAMSPTPVSFDLWQAHLGPTWGKEPGSPANPTVSLVQTVHGPSGVAVLEFRAAEDTSWLVRFDVSEHVSLSIDCALGSPTWGGACTPLLQPGESCPGTWQCDEGLACLVPQGTCQPTDQSSALQWPGVVR
jgi:hypothetical protein